MSARRFTRLREIAGVEFAVAKLILGPRSCTTTVSYRGDAKDPVVKVQSIILYSGGTALVFGIETRVWVKHGPQYQAT